MTSDDATETDPSEDKWPVDRLIHNPAELLQAFHAGTFKDLFDALEDNLDTDLLGRELDDERVVLMHLSLDFPFTRGRLLEVAEAEDTYAEAPYRAEALLEAIEDVEGLVAWLDVEEYRSRLPDADWIPTYRWSRAAPGEWTVADYLRERLDVGDDIRVHLTDGVGRRARAKMTLDELRASLVEQDETPHRSDRLCAPEAMHPDDGTDRHEEAAGSGPVGRHPDGAESRGSSEPPEAAEPDLRHGAAELLAQRVVGLLRTGERFTMDVGYAYVQAADITDEEGPAFWLELVSNNYLPEYQRLSARDEQQIRDLGFNDPDEDCANWWIGTGIVENDEFGRTEEELIEHIHECSRAAVDALVDAYRLSERFVAITLGVRVAPPPAPAPFEPEVGPSGLVSDVATFREGYVSYARERRTHPFASPWDADVPAAFFAIVMADDRAVVFDLIALAPTSGIDQVPGWWRFTASGWIPDRDATHRVDGAIVARLIDTSTARTLEKDMRF